MTTIPVIDISPIINSSGDQAALTKLKEKWDQAFRTVGFAVITGHGVDTTLIDDLYLKTKQFFALPSDEKLKFFKNEGYGTGGYVPVGMEAVGRTSQDVNVRKAPADLVESMVYRLDFADRYAHLPPQLRPEIEAYSAEMINLLTTIMRLSAMSLKLPEGYFEPHYAQPTAALRLAYYPPQKLSPNHEQDIADGQLRYGVHTDYQGFTILRQDPAVGGLEVRLPSTGQWISVSCDVKNSFVVNAGDLIQHWTNGLWRSNLHRVVNPGPSEAHLSRLSMVFFTGPNESTLVEPLESCVQITGGVALYPSVTASEHLHMKLQKSNTK